MICIKVSICLVSIALNSSKQAVVDQFNYSQKRYDRLVHNNNSMIIILRKSLNNSIWSKDGTLIDTTTPGQSGPESNSKEGYSKFSKPPSDAVWHDTQNT